jgi:hypothetical protein
MRNTKELPTYSRYNYSTRDKDIRDYGAVEQPDGSYIDRNGDIYWYNFIGKLHKDDGPAVIDSERVHWFINDNHYTFDDWCSELNIPDEQKLLLRLQYE